MNPWDAQSIRQYDADGVYPTLNANATGGLNRQGVVASFKGGQGAKAGGIGYQEDVAPTLTHTPSGTQGAPDVVYQNTGIGWWNESKVAETLRTPCGGDSTKANLVVGQSNRKYIVRRLTPLECCRLQGFPDWWKDGVVGSDSARYKMWGNGIALPCAADVLGKIAREMQNVSACQSEM